jgi:hypothetical protein
MPSLTPDTYTYKALEPDQIRLVSLSLTENDELLASIEATSFDAHDPPNYSALSYCWGGNTSTVAVSCNGADLHITSTLEAGLREITKSQAPTLLWVDQICINQNDTNERSEQVKKMNAIFNRTSRLKLLLRLLGFYSGSNRYIRG